MVSEITIFKIWWLCRHKPKSSELCIKWAATHSDLFVTCLVAPLFLQNCGSKKQTGTCTDCQKEITLATSFSSINPINPPFETASALKDCLALWLCTRKGRHGHVEPDQVAGSYSAENFESYLVGKDWDKAVWNGDMKDQRGERNWKIFIPAKVPEDPRGEDMESSVGIRTSTSLEQMVGCVGCCWEGLAVHLHKQQQSGCQGWQELVLLISASAKPLRSFCLHSKVTRWPSHLLWTLCVIHTSPGIQNWVSLSKISLPTLCGITNASFLLGEFASTATQRSLFKYRSGLCASGLNSLMLRLLCTTLAYWVFKVQV